MKFQMMQFTVEENAAYVVEKLTELGGPLKLHYGKKNVQVKKLLAIATIRTVLVKAGDVICHYLAHPDQISLPLCKNINICAP